MKRKILAAIFALCLALVGIFALSACGEDNGGDNNAACTHELEKTEAKAASCTEGGNTEYYTCKLCNKLFSDAEATTETALADTVITAKGHSYVDNKNETHHWTECSCGAKTEDIAHEYTIASKNETHHWIECTCGVKTEDITHDYTIANKNETHHWIECTCGAKTEDIAHDYTVQNKNDTHHWTECTCGAKTEEIAHEYTVQNKNETYHWNECACGAKTEDVSHDYTIANKNETHHWTECACGAKSDVTEHTYQDRVCTVCGAKKPTEGLVYTLSDDITHFSVTGIGTATDTDVVIPSTYNGLPVTSIGHHAFYKCTSLTSIEIPDSVTEIGNGAFFYCKSLASIEIPDSVTSIGNYAFYSCSGLTSITIPNSVISIGERTFNDCRGLTSVTIGNGVTSIDDRAFQDCTSLTSITFEGTMEQWNAIGKGSDWNYNTGEYTVHCTDGDIPKY